MPVSSPDAFAVVTFALYEEAPIACQGDDDQKKIRVIRHTLKIGKDIVADALRRSIELGVLHRTFVQVWDIQS